MNLSFEIHLICKQSADEIFERAFWLVGSSFTCHVWELKRGCHSVTGTITFKGSEPIESTLTTKHGLSYRISAPFVGFRFASQISPRLILIAINILYISIGKDDQFFISI